MRSTWQKDWESCSVAVVLLAFSVSACGPSGSGSATGSIGPSSTGSSAGNATASAGTGSTGTAPSTGTSGGSGSGSASAGTGTSSGGSCLDTQTDPSNCGSCGHECPAPDAGLVACVAGRCGVEVILASSPGLMDFAVDATSVYWRDQGTAANHYTDGAVLKVPIGGGPAVALAMGLTLAGDVGPECVGGLNSECSDDSYLCCPALPIQNPEIGVAQNNVYFATEMDAGGDAGLLWALMDVPVDGGAANLVVAPTLALTFVVDGTGLHIAELYESIFANVVNEELDGGEQSSGLLLYDVPNSGVVSTVLLASTASALAGAFCVGPYSGLGPRGYLETTTLSAKGGGQQTDSCPTAIAVDANNAYFTAGDDVTVTRVPLDGGTWSTLASSPAPRGLAVDATDVYWTDLDAGTVMKIATGGGAPLVVASGLSSPNQLVVDSTSVYVQDAMSLRQFSPK